MTQLPFDSNGPLVVNPKRPSQWVHVQLARPEPQQCSSTRSPGGNSPRMARISGTTQPWCLGSKYINMMGQGSYSRHGSTIFIHLHASRRSWLHKLIKQWHHLGSILDPSHNGEQQKCPPLRPKSNHHPSNKSRSMARYGKCFSNLDNSALNISYRVPAALLHDGGRALKLIESIFQKILPTFAWWELNPTTPTRWSKGP